jgi:hypothetical protein
MAGEISVEQLCHTCVTGSTREKDMDLDKIMKMLNGRGTVRLWPTAGQALGLSRGTTYRAAESGEIETLTFGHRKYVTTVWLARKLGLDGGGA